MATRPGERVSLEPAAAKELMARGRVALFVEEAVAVPELDDLSDEELNDLAGIYKLRLPKAAGRDKVLDLIRAHEAAEAGRS